MRSHKLRASLASASSGGGGGGGSGSSFSRGFYGGTGFTLNQIGPNSSANQYGPGTWSSSTKEEDNAWILSYDNNQSWFTFYYNSHFVQSVITAKELTDASVPSGAKFNKFSTYVWGAAGNTSANIPKGVRWNMHHTTDTTGNNSTGGYGPKSGESRTLLYQDQASTIFPPLSNAVRSGSDDTIASMHLQYKTILNGVNTAASGTGFLIEMSAGGGDDSSASPASFFTWNGSDDVVVEISLAKASYKAYTFKGLYKHRPWKPDVHFRNDNRDDCHYGSATWNGTGSGQGAFSTGTSNQGGNVRMEHTNTSESDSWYDITSSNWDITASAWEGSQYNVINALKLDYTT